MSAAIWSAIALAGCVWLLILAREIRHLSKPAEQPAPDRLAQLDARIAAERNSGRRTALRMIRNDELGDL